MSSYFILWFVLTIAPGHIQHIPMNMDESDHYPTQAACETAAQDVLRILTREYPDDPAIRVYCKEFPEPTNL